MRAKLDPRKGSAEGGKLSSPAAVEDIQAKGYGPCCEKKFRVRLPPNLSMAAAKMDVEVEERAGSGWHWRI